MASNQKTTDDEVRKRQSLAKASREALGTQSSERALHLVNQIAGTMPSLTRDDQDGIVSVLALFSSLGDLAPRDEAERMLLGQMIAVHEAAMDCFRRAMIEGQTPEARDMNLKRAEKLLSIYTRQLETLDKHRGKGKQKITVEHVNVHSGGQAIVGDVNPTRKDPSRTPGEPRQAPALAHARAAAEDGEELSKALSGEKTPTARRVRKR